MNNIPTITVAAALTLAQIVTDVQVQAAEEQVIEEVITIGSRANKPRSVTDSPVPIDVISGEDFNALGNNADITDSLRNLIPSYTATPATGDGSAFVRPTSLRGMSPDQTLVLVNGKRRHRSALVQFFAPAAGNGSHGVDVGMIPAIALKSVEVLRDGAAAQYGSDAIAGVINFVMKDASEGGTVQVQYGEFLEGESSAKVSANTGLKLGNDGFVSVSGEWYDNEALSRGIQRPDAQALIDDGITGVGADSPFGDEPLVQSWGRPQNKGGRFFINSGWNINDDAELYMFGNYADIDGRYRFFYRHPSHSTLPNEDVLPAGYTPFLDGAQTDYSLVGGWKGEAANALSYDFSVSYGKNQLDYFLNNTVNPDLRIPQTTGAGVYDLGQRDFDMGGYEQEEVNLNADFSLALSDSVNLAFGAEWREETFTTIAGETAALAEPSGPSGMTSVTPEDAGEFARDNWAVYGDVEHDITEKWLMQYALRYENFSDFGGTANGKVATRYHVTDNLTFRSAYSTGFHAPTPGQANVSTIITTFDGTSGLQVEEGLVPPTHPTALANGGAELTEEKSTNFSIGAAAQIGGSTSLTLDYYIVEVDDRIYRTGDIPVGSGGSVSFYTNTLELEHSGVDLVLFTDLPNDSIDTDLTLAYAYNKIDVTDQTLVNGVQPVSDGLVEDIENNYPEHRWTLTTNTYFGDDWRFMFRSIYYGEHYDERGRINGVDGNAPSAKVDPVIHVDLELNWDVTENATLTLGGANVFDEYPDKIHSPNANRISVGLPYPRRTVSNYEGASWYLRATYHW